MPLRSSSHDHDPATGTRPYRHNPAELRLDPDLFTTNEDVANPLPSPPYRRVASTSQVLIESYPEASPAYRSRSNVNLTEVDMSSDSRLDEKRQDPHDTDLYRSSKSKHAIQVHYQDTLAAPPIHRFEPEFVPASRASSIAGTDDEDDDEEYDWSGEEDLVDEEAKFEQAMGVKKTERKFGFVKCVVVFPFPSLHAYPRPTPAAQAHHAPVLHSHRFGHPLGPYHHYSLTPPFLLVQASSNRSSQVRQGQRGGVALLGGCERFHLLGARTHCRHYPRCNSHRYLYCMGPR